MSLSILFTITFYSKSKRIIRKSSNYLFCNSKETTNNFYLFCFAHLLTVGPSMIIYVSATVDSTVPPFFILFANLTLSSTGFVNATIYFFQRKLKSERNSLLLTQKEQDFHYSYESVEVALQKGLRATN